VKRTHNYIKTLIEEGGGFAFFSYGERWRSLRRVGKKKK
jgi:hypothetical protein